MRSIKLLRSIHFVLVAAVCPFLLLAIIGCDDSPTRSVIVRPDCWKPLVNEDEVAGFAEGAPAWSHDGLKVAYASEYDTCNDFNPIIIITDRFGLTKRAINIVGAHMRWLPGDTELVISAGRFGGPLVIYNLNTDEITPLGISTRFPPFDVSKDGERIYFEGDRPGQFPSFAIFEYDIPTSTLTELVIGAHPDISPDGTKLAFTNGDLFVLTIDSGITRSVGSGGKFPSWLPGGDRLVYDDRVGRIRITDLNGNSEFLIGELGAKGGGAAGRITGWKDNSVSKLY